MPIRLTVDVAARRLWATATGNLTFEECLDFIRTARAPVERRDWPLLVDASTATTTATEASVAALVDYVVVMAAKEPTPRGYVALAASDDQLFQRMLFYETKLAEANIRIVRVFRHVADAERWLGIMSASRRFAGG